MLTRFLHINSFFEYISWSSKRHYVSPFICSLYSFSLRLFIVIKFFKLEDMRSSNLPWHFFLLIHQSIPAAPSSLPPPTPSAGIDWCISSLESFYSADWWGFHISHNYIPYIVWIYICVTILSHQKVPDCWPYKYFSFVVLGPASAPLKEVTLVTHSAMKRASVLAKGMSLVPSVLSVILASMAWKARTHMVANSVSVTVTLAFVK